MHTLNSRLSMAVTLGAATVLFVSMARPAAQEPRPAGGAAPGAPAAQAAGRGPAPVPGTESGWATFQGQCAGCHAVVSRIGTTPTAWEIRQMAPERINAALQGKAHHERTLTDIQAQRVAEFMAGRPMGSVNAGDAKDMPNRCTANPEMSDPARGPSWNGWGNGVANTRFQAAAAAKLTAADVPRLKLRWAFGYPHGMTSSSQPTVASGRLFVASDNGYVYALDAKTGCVYWSYQQGSIVRGAPTVGRVSAPSARWAVFVGDGHAYVHAVDAQTGRQLWKVRVDEHPVARITGSVAYYDGRVFVPVSGSEEFNAGQVDYPCCTSRGAVVALDANTGKQIWKTYNVDEPKPWKKNPNGVQLYGPSAGGIWNAPTIDPARGALYVGTGDAVTPPESPLTDAVVAMDLKTGKVLWSYRAANQDLFMGGCNGPTRSEACPPTMGPDFDIGNSPILATLPNGKRVVFAGGKNADVYALDPDNNGKLLFRVNALGAAPGNFGRGGRGSIVWGGATDGRQVYYGTNAGGLVGLNPEGGQVWVFTAPGLRGGRAGLGAAPTAIPGVVFEGSTDGQLFAVSAADGKQIWSFNTTQDVETVNKVRAHGGAINTSGATVVDGMVYVSSGYAISAGASGGNVLLAFAAE